MKKQQLQQEIAELQKQLEEKQKALSAMPDKWRPKAGRFYVDEAGGVSESVSHLIGSPDFGNEYSTREQAEKAAKAMRAHNRLSSYVAEFAPDYEFNKLDKNWYVYFDFETSDWDYSYNSFHNVAGVVYMPLVTAAALSAKLNSGEVEL